MQEMLRLLLVVLAWKALDLIGFYMFYSYNNHKSLGSNSINNVLSWLHHWLCSIVLDLKTTILQDLIKFTKYHVLLYYIYHSDGLFSPQFINTKDWDGKL